MEADAEAYREVNKSQIEAGCKLISELNLSPGSKVLDMGCGTGEVTKHISDIVGTEGDVKGIDPDAARIKLAAETFKGVSNLEYRIGSSAIGFPYDNQPYYDAHVGMHAFHWVPPQEKKIYIQKAYRCLKPGGRLAILCLEAQGDHAVENATLLSIHLLSLEGYQRLFEEVGLFPNALFKRVTFQLRAKSLQEFKRWMKASSHHDFDELDPASQKETMDKFVTVQEDGSVSFTYPALSITATKI